MHIGFIGLGVMGEPMCRHLLQKRPNSQQQLLIHDLQPTPMERLAALGAQPQASADEVFQQAQTVFVSLPGGPDVQALLADCRWLQDSSAPTSADSRRTFVDLGTTPVDLTRQLAAQMAAHNVDYLDAPVARTRQAAEQGTLAISAGGPAEVYARIEPMLKCFASDVLHCGGNGAGQVVKILNNMVLFQTLVGLAEALAVGTAAGVDGEQLFTALSNGSADSFALRNHGVKALLADNFPLQAFSTRYARKDLDYALQLAEQGGFDLSGAAVVRELFDETIANGHGDNYWPVVKKSIEARTSRSKDT